MRLSVEEGTRQIPEQFVSGLHPKKTQSEKWLELLSDGENKTDPFHLFVFLKKYEKKVLVIHNDGEHTLKIEGGASSLQVFSCNHKLIIGLQWMLLNPEQILGS